MAPGNHPRIHASTHPPNLSPAFHRQRHHGRCQDISMRLGDASGRMQRVKRWSRELVAAIKAARCNLRLRFAAVVESARLCRLVPSPCPLMPLLGGVVVALSRYVHNAAMAVHWGCTRVRQPQRLQFHPNCPRANSTGYHLITRRQHGSRINHGPRFQNSRV